MKFTRIRLPRRRAQYTHEFHLPRVYRYCLACTAGETTRALAAPGHTSEMKLKMASDDGRSSLPPATRFHLYGFSRHYHRIIRYQQQNRIGSVYT
jgi:hypothetical protein